MGKLNLSANRYKMIKPVFLTDFNALSDIFPCFIMADITQPAVILFTN